MKKVIIGLSGGVDSSVAALLLIKQQYNVEAVYMQNWDRLVNNEINFKDKEDNCTQEEDYKDALKVAEQLNIKLHRVNFVEEYWKEVFQYLLDEYNQGRTPNPDVFCNSHIKFKYFQEYAVKNLNADYIATGHYCKNVITENNNFLSIPKDRKKDQTYFLCDLKEDQLKNVIFPLENLLKTEVRKIAKDNNLYTAEKKDSTGVCFVGERDFKKFLENYVPHQSGNIVDWNTKEIVGKHDGVMYYTIGQRKGLNLSGFVKPYFVIGKNILKKELYVGLGKDNEYLLGNKCIIKHFNWINEPAKNISKLQAKFRYRQELQNVHINFLTNKNNLEIISDTKQRALTPGQFAVLYKDDVCLGGGIISEVFNNDKKCVYL